MSQIPEPQDLPAATSLWAERVHLLLSRRSDFVYCCLSSNTSPDRTLLYAAAWPCWLQSQGCRKRPNCVSKCVGVCICVRGTVIEGEGQMPHAGRFLFFLCVYMRVRSVCICGLKKTAAETLNDNNRLVFHRNHFLHLFPPLPSICRIFLRFKAKHVVMVTVCGYRELRFDFLCCWNTLSLRAASEPHIRDDNGVPPPQPGPSSAAELSFSTLDSAVPKDDMTQRRAYECRREFQKSWYNFKFKFNFPFSPDL